MTDASREFGTVRTARFLLPIGQNYYEIFVREATPEVQRGEVVLIPDFLGNSEDFDPIIPFLVRNGVRVMALDLPGRGKSAALPREEYTLVNMARSVDAVLQHLGSGKTTILGQRWGALVAMVVAMTRPKDVTKAIMLDIQPVWQRKGGSTLDRMIEIAGTRYPDKDTLLGDLADVWSLFGASKFRPEAFASRIKDESDGYRLAVDPSAFGIVSASRSREYDFRWLLEKVRHPQVFVFGGAAPKEMQEVLGAEDSAPRHRFMIEHAGKNNLLDLSDTKGRLITLGAILAR